MDLSHLSMTQSDPHQQKCASAYQPRGHPVKFIHFGDELLECSTWPFVHLPNDRYEESTGGVLGWVLRVQYCPRGNSDPVRLSKALGRLVWSEE